eukprot:IDg19367t1
MHRFFSLLFALATVSLLLPLVVQQTQCTTPSPAPEKQYVQLQPPEHMPAVITLHYGSPYDKIFVLHNCIQAERASVSMIVYTDNTRMPYCTVCKCRQFTPTQCPPPGPHILRNHCEKLSFVQRMLEERGELIYLDSDLMVMHRSFFRLFGRRAKDNAFLAPLNELTYEKRPRYDATFNSGLFYMRTKRGVNASALVPMMYRTQSGNDQNVLSYFVRGKYAHDWDYLSWKWHCRAVLRLNMDVPLQACLTVHDRR